MTGSGVRSERGEGQPFIGLLCISIALIAILLPEAGRILDLPALARVGAIRSATDFLQIVACLSLCVAHLLIYTGRPRVRARLALLPAGIALLPLPVFAAAGQESGQLLPLALFATLVVASLLQTLRLRRAGLIAALLSAFSIGPLVFLLLGYALDSSRWGDGVLTLPGIVALLMLGVGLLLHSTRRIVDQLPDDPSVGWRALRYVVPVLMVTPAIIGVSQIAIFSEHGSRDWMHFTAMFVNTAIVGVVLLWALRRISLERGTLLAFSRTVDASPIAIVDADDRILYWSRGCEQLYGFSRDAALGRNKYELLNSRPTDGRDLALMTIEERATGVELEEVRQDGRMAQVLEVQVTATHRDLDEVKVLSLTDLGPRATAEKELRDSETRLMLAAQVHNIGVFEWDVASTNLRWIGNTDAFLGLPSGAMSNYADWAAMVLPEDRDAVDRRREAAMWAKADRFSFFYRMRLPDGRIRAIEGSSRCFYDDAGQLVRTVGVNIDVTDRVEREAQLAAREAQLRSVLETVPDAMIVIDEKGSILTFSRAAESIFGYPAEAVVGHDVSLLMPDRFAAGHRGGIERYIRTGERRVIGHTRLLAARHSDGHEFPIEARVGEVFFNGTRAFTGFIRDISSQVETERRMEAMRSDLAHVARLNAMGEMAAGIAHEINQPLAAVANYLATAEVMSGAGAAPERIAEKLAAAREQAVRAGEIIRRMRDFATRQDSDVRVLRTEEVLRDAAALVHAGSGTMAATIGFALSPGTEFIYADRVQLQQVLVNLLRNSIEAVQATTRDRAEITIEAKQITSEWVEMAVRDNGPGLDSDVTNQLFTPFTTTKGNRGMGIGLSICRRIVEAHGGTLTAENRPEGGACFRFTVPLYTAGEDEA